MLAFSRNIRTPRTLSVLAAVLVLGACDASAPEVERPDSEAQVEQAPVAESGTLADVLVLSRDAQEVPVVPVGGGVLLVISSQCGHCHALLDQWGEITQGEHLSKLHVLVIEGAEAGLPILSERNVDAVQVSGPVGDDIMAFASALKVSATPTLIQVDAEGRELAREEGSLGQEQARTWIARAR